MGCQARGFGGLVSTPGLAAESRPPAVPAHSLRRIRVVCLHIFSCSVILSRNRFLLPLLCGRGSDARRGAAWPQLHGASPHPSCSSAIEMPPYFRRHLGVFPALFCSCSLILLSCCKNLLPKGFEALLATGNAHGRPRRPAAGHGAGELHPGSRGPWLAPHPRGCDIPSNQLRSCQLAKREMFSGGLVVSSGVCGSHVLFACLTIVRCLSVLSVLP